ncbi:MAG: hypothetical protein SGI77_05680 [Pirellulaceae bacterium]|nr:hypothetical protein [Pirellulaceae bacterium]
MLLLDRIFRMVVPVVLGTLLPCLAVSTTSAQELPWEFSPYRMRLWLSIDPALPCPASVHEKLLERLRPQMEIVYGPTADIDAQATPRSLFSSILRELDQFTIQHILDSEFVLVVGRNHPDSKEIRTLETIVEKSEAIYLASSNLNEVKREIVAFEDESIWKRMSDKLVGAEGSTADFLAKLKTGDILTALIRRSELETMGRSVRFIPTRFPWQLDSLLKTHDKIFAVSITATTDEQFQIQIREIDCVVRVVGPLVTATVPLWEAVPRAIAYASQNAFAPLARIEDADLKTAQLRIRAGGLVMEEEHPAKLMIGDVLQPYVRRDDRNGVPTLLQNIPWTYVAMTSGDSVNAHGSIFTGIRSPLAGRKNKRTRKICLRVRPVTDSTDLQMGVVIDPKIRIPGAEVYRRTPGTEDLTFESRSDWRGIATLGETKSPVATYDVPVPRDAEGGEEPKKVDPNKKPEKATVQLRAPLYLYYVKHGNTLLARLPVVTGLSEVEIAALPDDRRRLESEAFIKGVQSEILDIVARRQILATRIKQRVQENKKAEAGSLLKELQEEKTYESMSKQLDMIQGRILASDREKIPSVSQKRIDQMFNLTRQMLQRYLQDSLVRDMELAVGKLGG